MSARNVLVQLMTQADSCAVPRIDGKDQHHSLTYCMIIDTQSTQVANRNLNLEYLYLTNNYFLSHSGSVIWWLDVIEGYLSS